MDKIPVGVVDVPGEMVPLLVSTNAARFKVPKPLMVPALTSAPAWVSVAPEATRNSPLLTPANILPTFMVPERTSINPVTRFSTVAPPETDIAPNVWS